MSDMVEVESLRFGECFRKEKGKMPYLYMYGSKYQPFGIEPNNGEEVVGLSATGRPTRVEWGTRIYVLPASAMMDRVMELRANQT